MKKKDIKQNNSNIDTKKLSIVSLIRKEKYIDQFKDLVLESKKIGKVSFTKIKKFFNPEVLNTSKFEIILSFLNNQGISVKRRNRGPNIGNSNIEDFTQHNIEGDGIGYYYCYFQDYTYIYSTQGSSSKMNKNNIIIEEQLRQEADNRFNQKLLMGDLNLN